MFALLSLAMPYTPQVRVAILIAGVPLVLGLANTAIVAVFQARLRMDRAAISDVAGRAAGFVALICVAILALSGWREWEARNAELRAAEVDVANLAQSLVQHADDTFELVDTILVGP